MYAIFFFGVVFFFKGEHKKYFSEAIAHVYLVFCSQATVPCIHPVENRHSESGGSKSPALL